MTQPTSSSNSIVLRLGAEVVEISGKLNQALESDVRQNEELARQRNEIDRLNAVIFGTKTETEKQAKSLNGRVNALDAEIETIHGRPPLMRLNDGSVWKLNTFLGLNLHIWGWKSGDQIIVSKNKSWFSTFGSFFFHNITRSSISSGSMVFDSGEKYKKI